jgi:hypothetical protein
MRIHGSCHCGNISFELTWEPSPAEIPARACGCSFCTKHGGAWTSSPNGSLKVDIKDRSSVLEYAFGTQTALFHICRQCGVVPVATSEIAGRLYAVVSVNAFDDVARSMLQRLPVSFEGESTESRLVRRARNWVPNVQFTETGT